MKKAVLFGAGGTLEQIIHEIKKDYDVLYVTDNNESMYGDCICDNILIKDKRELSNGGFDCVVITSVGGFKEIYAQLINEFNLPSEKIVCRYVESSVTSRIDFIEFFRKIANDLHIKGSVAEVGVFRGELAKEINRIFYDRTCYLFDTFEGFDERAFEFEDGASRYNTELFKFTSVDLVMSKLPYKEKACIKKGYFPETFDLKNETFCFVNLDTDLYRSILDGLNIFYPLLAKGGIILIHDYFDTEYSGVQKAVHEFAEANSISFMPIGDKRSVAFVK